MLKISKREFLLQPYIASYLMELKKTKKLSRNIVIVD